MRRAGGLVLGISTIIDQYTHGIIFHFPCTAASPNFALYHCLLVAAVMPRFTATKAKQDASVLLTISPLGAANTAKDRYIAHSAI